MKTITFTKSVRAEDANNSDVIRKIRDDFDNIILGIREINQSRFVCLELEPFGHFTKLYFKFQVQFLKEPSD